MFWQILKKDIMKRKGVNAILFIFITMSTIFLSSSINNIMVISSGLEYYMDYANVPDLNVILNSEVDKNEIDQWLLQEKEKGMVDDFDFNHFVEISNKHITIQRNGKEEVLDNKGASLYLATMDVEYCKVFDEFKEVPQLSRGEIALSLNMMNNANLQIGDVLVISNQNVTKEFTITEVVKDASFGNDMVGMSRLIVNEEDFKEYEDSSTRLGVYYIMTSDVTGLSKALNNQGFEGVLNDITIDTYKLVYSFDMVVAGLLILIGICLILIALLVLRFTIVFSIEEQFQEIGILKAIGLRNLAIKKLYLVKYLAIVVIGALVGTMFSIPVSQAMIEGVSTNMIMSNDELNIGVNIACALFIIVLVLAFCYLCTRMLNKVSAITAIRGGYTGERFHKNKGLRLSRFHHLSVTNYLGMNDILSHLTRYIVLIITFCISFILITIPLNTINTMNSTQMMRKFSIDPDSSVYLRKIENKEGIQYRSVDDLKVGMKQVESEMEAKGYQVELSGEPIYFINYSDSKMTRKSKIMTLQIIGEECDFLDYEEGQHPQLENEVAFSKDIMNENSWVIGDSVNVEVNGENRSMIITGFYTDYMQLGKSARFNSKIDCSKERMFDYWTVMVDMKTDLSQDELVTKLEKEFPDYEWRSAQQVVDESVGGIQDVLKSMLMPMTLMLCAIIMLITLLMEKLFITREKGEIAMLKSIGFRHRAIRNWQMMRMCLVVVVSMIISIPLSLLSNQFVLKPIFAIMGADVAIQVDPIQAYLIYPGILLIGIMLATMLATHQVKHINIREMNNVE